MFRFQQNPREAGAAGLMTVIGLLGICLVALLLFGRRADDEMRAEGHQEILVDKLKVKSALKSMSDCRNIDLNAGCTVGSTIALPKRGGGELVAADGTTVIGKWNTRIECLAKSPTAYWVSVARPDGNSSFLKDPLTGQPLGWSALMPLKEACSLMGSDLLILRSDSCYGAIQGLGQLPPEIAAASHCTGLPCKYVGKYCTEAQRPFPVCPAGYQNIFRYVDRYGWGGIDLTKYTICSRLN